MMICCSLFALLIFLQYLPFYSAIYHVVVKIIMGLCCGYLSFLCPLFIFEISPVEERGRLIGLVQFMITLGVLYTEGMEHLTLVAFGVHRGSQEQEFSFGEKMVNLLPLFIGPFCLSLSILIIFILKLKLETPQHYLNEENSVKIIEALSQILQPDSVQKANLILIEQDKYQTFIQSHSTSRSKCKLFLIGSSVLVLQVCCGINAILLLLYQIAPFNLQITNYFYLIASVNCVSLIFYLLFLYKVSHKLLLVGGLFLLSSSEASAFIFSFNRDYDSAIGFIFGLSCFFVFIFELSIGPIALIQTHQILQPREAGYATGLNWTCNLIITLSITLANTNGTLQTLNLLSIFFIGACILGAMMIILYYPEVQMKYKSEIQTQICQMKTVRDTAFSSLSYNEDINYSG